MKAYKVFKRRDGILTSSILHSYFSQEILPFCWNKAQRGKFFIFDSLDSAKEWMQSQHEHTENLELWEVQIPSDFEIEWEPIDRHNFEEFWTGEDANAMMIMKRPPSGTFLTSSFKLVAVISQ